MSELFCHTDGQDFLQFMTSHHMVSKVRTYRPAFQDDVNKAHHQSGVADVSIIRRHVWHVYHALQASDYM